jgi:hypothetical protein
MKARRRSKNKKKKLDPEVFDKHGRFKTGNRYRWKKGMTGNKKGRPPAAKMSTHLRRELNRICPIVSLNPKGDRTWIEIICESLFVAAVMGKNNVSAIKEIREATEGTMHTVKSDWKKELQDMGLDIDPDEIVEQLTQSLESKLCSSD